MTRAAAHVRNVAGPLLRAVYRPAVVNVDALPLRRGVLLAVAGDPAVRMPLNGVLPRPILEISDGPWPEWAAALGDSVGWFMLGQQRRSRLRAAADVLAEDAVAYRVQRAEGWDWLAYLHMHSGAPVLAVSLLAARRTVVHLASPREFQPAHDRAGLRRVAESIRQYTTDHLRVARARAGRQVGA